MNPVREAVTLPALFLTVVLVAGMRPGAAVVIQPPTLAALVSAVALFGLFVRSGALAPGRLVNPQRSWLANANGVSVLLSLFAASAQIVTLVMPDSGVPALLGWAVLAALLLQAYAIDPDRVRLLRGLLVTFAAAFTIKFVVIDALSSPAESRLGRVLRALFEGVTLGAFTQPPRHGAEGYLAFAAIALFVIALAILPSASWRMVRAPDPRQLRDEDLLSYDEGSSPARRGPT